MIVHCMICSVNGEHVSADSAIATIDTDKLALPLQPEMFTSVNPEREIPPPWTHGVDWRTMRCPRGNHLPWGIPFDGIDQAIKQGGPKQLLTDTGMIDVMPISEIETSAHLAACPICGRHYNTKGIQNHITACRRKTK